MKHFTILNNTVLVVELPEGAKDESLIKDLYLSGDVFQWYFPDKNGVVNEVGSVDLPPGNWQYLGPLTSIPEEVLAEVVEKHGNTVPVSYKDYLSGGWLWSSYESLLSAIRAAGWYTSNPYDNNPEVNKGMIPGYFEKEWLAAQERVLNRERTYLFKIKS